MIHHSYRVICWVDDSLPLLVQCFVLLIFPMYNMFVVTQIKPHYITSVEARYLLLVSNVIFHIFYICREDKSYKLERKLC